MTTTAERPVADTALVVYDAANRSVDIPTNVQGLVLHFFEGQAALDAAQLHILSPIGIRADWDPNQVLVFLMTCRERGFDPWAKEAYLMKYKGYNGNPDTYSFHIGIDGFRGKAEDTGEYRGVEGPLFSRDGATWSEVWPDPNTVPKYAKAGVKRKRPGEPIEVQWAQISYDEYAPTKDVWIQGRKTDDKELVPMWRPATRGGKPMVMSGKCAEAVAFRKAFPRRFAQFYEPAEMERLIAEAKADAPDPVAVARQAAYAAAHQTTPETVDAEVVEEKTDPWAQYGGEAQARLFLLAEIDEQAEILGKTLAEYTARLRDKLKTPLADAPADELMKFTQRAKRWIVQQLNDDGKHTEADTYDNAPPVGDCRTLFGRGPAVTDPEVVL